MILRYLIVLLTVTVFAVLGVAQQTRVVHLGYRVECLDEEGALLAENSRRLICEISALSHPARIAGELGRLHIGLLDPIALSKASADKGPGEHPGLLHSGAR